MGKMPRMSRFSRKSVGVAALSFPTWAYLVFFFIIPISMVLWYSFGYKPDLFTAHSNDTLSFSRYAQALEPTFLSTFTNTLQIAGLGTLICLLIGVPFAYWMAVKVPAKWRGLLIALVLVPFWTNFLVRTLGWQIMLAPEGFVSDALQNMGITGGPLDILYTRAAVQLGVVYNYLPLMILPLFVSMDSAGNSLREASRDLGANRWRTMWQVTLPLAMPGVIAGCLLVFIPLMGDYITASVLGGAQGNMVGQLVANQFNSAQNWALGSAMAVLLMVFTLLTVAIVGGIYLIIRAILRFNRRVLIEESAS